VLRSVDLKRWHQVAVFNTVGDDREPNFCVTPDCLFLYFGTFYTPIGSGPGPFVTHVTSTNDGLTWSKPKSAWKDEWIWRVRFYNGAFYGTSYGFGPTNDICDHNHGPLKFLKSSDGIHWKVISTVTGMEDGPNEADMYFHPDGEVWIIARTFREPANHSLFFSSRPPYHDWERIDLKVLIGPPCFCESGGVLYVAGRRDMNEVWIPQSIPAGSTAIYTVEYGKVTPFFAFPSYGDAGYPGLISQKPSNLLISYYSQHAYLSGVIDSVTPVPPTIPNAANSKYPELSAGDDDIFIAEISVQ
jgi:hypothetical protein